MAAAAQNVSFDILLGGKVTPEVLKVLKALKDIVQYLGALGHRQWSSALSIREA